MKIRIEKPNATYVVPIPMGDETAGLLGGVFETISGSGRSLILLCTDSTTAVDVIARLAEDRRTVGDRAAGAGGESTGEPVARRKRGRPRKRPMDDQPDPTVIPGAAYRMLLASAGNDAPKRGPGRPRKHPAASAEQQPAQEGVQ